MWVFSVIWYDPNADITLVITNGVSKIFLFAIIGASVGAYYGRQKAKLLVSTHADSA